MQAAIEAFERQYVDRARASATGPIDGILLGRETDASPSGRRFLAGWWCTPDADARVVVLPNPWDDRSAIPLYDAAHLAADPVAARAPVSDARRTAWRDTAARRTGTSCSCSGSTVTVTAAIDRLLFLDTARALAPEAPLLATHTAARHARHRSTTPPTSRLGDEWNAAFLSTVCERAGYELRRLPAAPAPPASAAVLPVERRSAASRTLDLAPRVVLRRLVERQLGSWDGRRIALLGATNFTSSQLYTLARDVPACESRRGVEEGSSSGPDGRASSRPSPAGDGPGRHRAPRGPAADPRPVQRAGVA